MIEFRERSESVGVTGLALALLGGTLAAVAGAWLYQFLVDVVPFIYVKVLFTVAFGIGVGCVVGLVARTAKGRGAAAVGIVGLLVGLAGDAASFKWAYDRQTARDLPDVNRALAAESLPAITLDELRDRFPIGEYVDARVEAGFHVGRSSSKAPGLGGFFVWLVWAAEAAILGIGSWYTSKSVVDLPFCDACDAWAVTQDEGSVFGVSRAAIREAVGAGDLKALLSPHPVDACGETAVYTVYECPGCEAATLSVDVAWTKTDKKGKSEKEQKEVVRDVVLTKQDRQTLAAGLTAANSSSNRQEEP